MPSKVIIFHLMNTSLLPSTFCENHTVKGKRKPTTQPARENKAQKEKRIAHGSHRKKKEIEPSTLNFRARVSNHCSNTRSRPNHSSPSFSAFSQKQPAVWGLCLVCWRVEAGDETAWHALEPLLDFLIPKSGREAGTWKLDPQLNKTHSCLQPVLALACSYSCF